jgi:hypothetical protein
MGMARARPSWKPWGDHPVVVAILVLTAIIGTVFVVLPLLQREYRIEYTGRVLDSRSLVPVRGAKVSFAFQGAPPIVYTDSEGVYRFTLVLRSESVAGQVSVEAAGYERYDRNITLSSNIVQLEDIRLTAETSAAPTPSSPTAGEATPVATIPQLRPNATTTPSPAFPTVWNGEYYNNENLNGNPVLTRQNEAIDFVWNGQSPESGIPIENWSARWTTSQCFNTDSLSFYMNYDDGIRLSIDGNVVWDAWNGPPQEVWKDFAIPNCPTIIVEYHQLTGGGRIKVGWFEQLSTTSIEELRLSGFSALVQRDYQQAITDYSRVIEIVSNNPQDYVRRGIAYMNTEQNDEAIADFTRAIEIDRNNLEGYNLRGSAYINNEMYPQAVADFDKAISIDPNNAEIYHSRGVAYMASKEFAKAIADFRKVLELSDDTDLRDRAKENLRELGVDADGSLTPTITVTPTTTPSTVGYNFESDTQRWTASEAQYKPVSFDTSTETVYSGSRSLRVTTDLYVGSENVFQHTEALVYFPDARPEGIGLSPPYNLTGKQVSCFVYMPTGLVPDGTNQGYLRLFVKDDAFRNQYGEPVGVTIDNVAKWIQLSLRVGVGDGMDNDFNPARTNALGVRIDLYDTATLRYSGPLFIDHCVLEFP